MAGWRHHAVLGRERDHLGRWLSRSLVHALAGTIKPGTVYNDIISHEDWMPTFLAAAGVPDIVQKVAEGYKVGDKTFKQHLDGYNFLPYLQGKEQKGPRHQIFYFDQAGNLNAVRYDDWKVNFATIEGAINTAYRKTPAWPSDCQLTR